MQVDVVGRIPKRDRRECSPRANFGLRVEAPDALVARYPDQLVPVEPGVPELARMIEDLDRTIEARSDALLEAAITSDVVPKPAPQPIKPPRRRRSKQG